MKTKKMISRFFLVTSVAQAAFYAYILTKKVKKKGSKKVVKNMKNKLQDLV